MQRRLQVLAGEFERGARSFDPGGAPKTGATLVRQWRGHTHTVLVRENGFEYDGRRYRSLTVIAERITGAHWSGPRFFGLGKQQEAAPERPPPPEQEYTDHQAAALWLGNTISLADINKRPWLHDVARAYTQWTATAKGAGLAQDEEIAHPPAEWNYAYFDLLAHCLAGLESQELDDIALTPITSLPDEPFFDVVTHFLRSDLRSAALKPHLGSTRDRPPVDRL